MILFGSILKQERRPLLFLHVRAGRNPHWKAEICLAIVHTIPIGGKRNSADEKNMITKRFVHQVVIRKRCLTDGVSQQHSQPWWFKTPDSDLFIYFLIFTCTLLSICSSSFAPSLSSFRFAHLPSPHILHGRKKETCRHDLMSLVTAFLASINICCLPCNRLFNVQSSLS